jgi:sugar/nucleoside kinase (ribokinase family)
MKLGAQADLCTVLGNPLDPMTVYLRNMLLSKGIGLSDVAYLESQPCPISTIMILPNGDRAITSFQPKALSHTLNRPENLNKYDMVAGDTNRLCMVRQVLSIAKSQGIKTMLDVDRPLDRLQDIPQADIVFFSRESWDKMKDSKVDIFQAQSYLGGVVGVTDGPGRLMWTDPTQVLHSYQPLSVDAVNTLGAGDVFRAGLAMGICLGMDLPHAIKQGCDTAAEHIQNKTLTRITGESHETI